MATSLDDLYLTLAEYIRKPLADAGKSWAKAWLKAEDLDGSFSVWLEYRPKEVDEVLDDIDVDRDAFDVFRAVLPLTLHADGRRWTRAQFTLHPNDKHEATFEYPVPPPVEGRHYSPAEIHEQLAACVRQNLSRVPWVEAWLEADDEYGYTPFMTYRTSPDGPREDDIRDCNYIRRWIRKLEEARRRIGEGRWSTGRMHFFPDGRFDAKFEGSAAPLPSEEPPPPLGDLIREIETELRDDMFHYAQVLRRDGTIQGTWHAIRVDAQWDDDLREAVADCHIEFTDGQVDDTFTLDEVEYLLTEIYQRLDAGEDPQPLVDAGAHIGQTKQRRLTMTVRNTDTDVRGG